MKLSTLLSLGVGIAGLALCLDIRRKQEQQSMAQEELMEVVEGLRTSVDQHQAKLATALEKVTTALTTERAEKETLKTALAEVNTRFDEMVIAEGLEDEEQHAEAAALREALATATAAADTTAHRNALLEIKADLEATPIPEDAPSGEGGEGGGGTGEPSEPNAEPDGTGQPPETPQPVP